ncbi:MAG: hypothetical protein BYD32DRAFT_228565 [Podila humilis]|nr:MAG: hypothetical protein BYD32DRAFT_228565 [Podila humilis]
MLEAPAHRAAKQNSKTRALSQAKLAAAATAAAATASMTADRKEVPTKQPDHTNETVVVPNGVAHDTPRQEQEQEQNHDVEMKEADAEEQEQDEEDTTTDTTSKGIDQEDLDGGLLDGALDDVEEEEEDDDEEDGDQGHDTEDTEVGNENGSSDEDEHMNGPEEDKELSPGEPNGASHETHEEEEEEEEEREDNHVAKTVHEADEDVSMADEHDGSTQAHSDDSDSEHPGAEGSEHEGEEDEEDEDEDGEEGEEDEEEEDGEDEEEGSAAPEDDDEDEDEEEEAPLPPPPVVKKEITLSQKPTLNRPQIIEEELKDSGDDLSDLSEFDDTDDSDEDEEITQPKTNKAGSVSGSTTLTSTRAAAAAAAAAVTATSVSARAAARGQGGRKKSLREASSEPKQDEDKAEAAKQEEEAQKTSSRTRQGGSPKTARSKSKTADVQLAEKGSGSEALGGEEERAKVEGEDEEEEDTPEDEEEDLEAKQVHKDALEALTSIEVEFATLRDRMYDERMLELDKEVDMINAGTHPELSSLMREIHVKREQRLQIAKKWRTHKGEIAQCQFEIAEYQAHCTFQSSRRNTRADLTRDLGRQQRTLILDLARTSNDRKRKSTADKVVLVKARKQKRIEANNLSIISERRGFPINSPLRMMTTIELDEDFSAMGLSHPATMVNIDNRPMPSRMAGQVFPTGDANPLTRQYGPVSGSKWAQSHTDYSAAGQEDVEIYGDAPRCNVDGIWYKPNDAVVVLDASIGKYSAKFLYLSNDEILLQKTDGSKTRLHLSLFKSRKLYMQPRS